MDLIPWAGIPAFVLTIILGYLAFGPLGRVEQRHYHQQRSALVSRAESRSANTTQHVDWMQYGLMSKDQIIDIMGKQGWGYVEQRIEGRRWNLQFSQDVKLDEGYRSGRSVRTENKLINELRNAVVDDSGIYWMRIDLYLELPYSDVERLCLEYGWSINKHQREPWSRGILQLY